ncbi:[Fe-S]-binding protein [Candidatus Bathyarchaeota archaeon]|nr:MAG: [Fe-S]-binding protein [Candidatus Bathyarchaeota archaeon]
MVKLRLIYNHKSLGKPILAEVILKTGIPMNILEATVSPISGEILVDIDAPREKIDNIISLLEDLGVNVKEITQILEIDVNRCTSCGACVSPCPTHALTLNQDLTLNFDEKKCVRCGICVDACPMRAIRFAY